MPSLRLFDAAGDGFRLVQARHDDAQFNWVGHEANLLKRPALWRARVLAQRNLTGGQLIAWLSALSWSGIGGGASRIHLFNTVIG